MLHRVSHDNLKHNNRPMESSPLVVYSQKCKSK